MKFIKEMVKIENYKSIIKYWVDNKKNIKNFEDDLVRLIFYCHRKGHFGK